MNNRIHNLSAGPAVLPLEVLEIVQSNILNFKGSGLGVMELSHRGAQFEEILSEANSTLRELLGIGEEYAIAYMTGGATNQFSAVPMNLLGAGCGNYILSGVWSEKALNEAKKFGKTHVAASSKEQGYRSLPSDITLSENPAYLHFTSNNTIYGTQYVTEPPCPSHVPLVCDASSDFLCRKLDITKYGLVYAGAQKNIGTSGVTLVIIQKDLLQNIPDSLPLMLDYRSFTETDSLLNTPPCFSIYVLAETLKWVKRMGGVESMYARNKEKAELLYSTLDASDFYETYAENSSRSLMNITFQLRDSSLDESFLAAAERAGFSGLKGHRSVGGFRASIYNAFPLESAKALAEFLGEFESQHSS